MRIIPAGGWAQHPSAAHKHALNPPAAINTFTLQAVAEHMASKVADLRLQHAVQRIEWGAASSSNSAGTATASGSSSSGGTSDSGSGSARVRILCSNGDSLEADAAIVTVSLGVLQAQHQQLFSPGLPPEKVAAIDRLCIGCVNKLFLDFGPADAAAGSSSGSGSSRIESLAAGSNPAVSYSLLWSEPWDGASSSSTFAAAVPSAVEAQLPGWAKGIFSIRFGGPETKQPQLAGERHSTVQPAAGGATAGGSDSAAHAEEGEEEAQFVVPCAEPQQPQCFQGVAWVAGEAALAMEAASDEEVLCVLRQLAALFPQLQLPPGASWDRVRLHR